VRVIAHLIAAVVVGITVGLAAASIEVTNVAAHNASTFGAQCGYASWNDPNGVNHNFRWEFGVPIENFPEFQDNYHMWAAWITEYDWIEVGPYFCGLQVG
jgi:hypothetical protein